MGGIGYDKKCRYTRLENGSFVPEDEPDSAARRLHKRSHTIAYHVREWTLVSNVEGFDQSKERQSFTHYRDTPAGVTLRCYLENDKRVLWSIREEGIKPVRGDFELRIVPIAGAEIEGAVWHYIHSDDSKDEKPEAEAGAVDGSLGIPEKRFEWIVEKLLKHPDARLVVTLAMQLYKEEIALAFDDDWMSQDFLVPHDTYTPIESYDLSVAYGPGLQRLIGQLDEGEGGDAPEELDNDGSDSPSELPAVARTSVDPTQRDNRLTIIVWLMAVLVAFEVFR